MFLSNKEIGGSSNSKEPELGDKFLDIQGIGLSGQIHSLASLKGKFILLDFWASWCGPCRKENPNLLSLYKRYRSEGFEIFSYSVDQNSKAWKKAVAADSLIWTNVIEQPDGNYFPSEAIYKVKLLPTSYLINPDGIIVAKDFRGTELEGKLKEVLDISFPKN
ncbi:TlpA family protein disulfide reductase [Algoriphagus lacus]|uniref:TlpA family protein disulfide reductase n=1 Tax=Algoriphagus lacus TaxID=2056311 RepID=UPI0013150011|nr:TlpA disulfide reductase family protein [Algoriphagus lacus]